VYTMLQQHQYEKLGEPPIGSQLLLTTSDGSSFTIRETILSGTYSYSAEDALMQNIILTDADIIRSLAGYVSFSQNGTISTEQQERAEVNVDDLFSELPQESAPQNSLSAESALESALESEGLQLSDVEDILNLTPERLAGRQIKESAWHFILIALNGAHSFNKAKAEFEQFGMSNEHRLLNWRNTAGGDALITFFLQILVNGGVGLVLMCIAFVTMNMISLSILERKREFGTMRALGATRMRIAGYMVGEVFLMIVPVIVLGLLCGSLCTSIINSRAIVLNDRYISLLFGSNTLRGSIDMRLIVSHIVLGIVFILLCIPYPLTKILNIQPFKAMS
ncbi:MAG: ABC transporter permease, partial [Salinispira sp.]